MGWGGAWRGGPLGRYELCEKLGEGTYGKVYRGMDKVTREPVAIKRMK